MGFTQRLAHFVEGKAFGDLPPHVVDTSKNMMINAAAVGLAGAAQPEGQSITRFVQEMGGNGKCTIIGMGLRTSPVNAALANGTMVHLLDFDDEIVGRGIHPSSVVFPVVMALGEMNGYGGREVLNAFALGCEVASKLAGMRHPQEGATAASWRWAGEGIAESVGATAAAGRLLELDQDELERAFGIACGGAAGIQASPATPDKALQCGRAAMNGVMAALLAQGGFGGPLAVDTSGGLPDCLGSEDSPDQEAFFSRLGDPYDVVQPGVALKAYPSHSAGHTAIDAVIQLVQQYRIEPGQVESVRVGVAPAILQALPFSNPRSGREARLSLNFAVAAALLYGQPLIEQFTDPTVAAPEIREMMDRVTVESTVESNGESTGPSGLLTSRAATVTIALSEGRQLQHQVEFARGQPELPLAPEEVDAKFLYCCRYILPPDHIDGAIAQLRDLENVKDVTGLASILGG